MPRGASNGTPASLRAREPGDDDDLLGEGDDEPVREQTDQTSCQVDKEIGRLAGVSHTQDYKHKIVQARATPEEKAALDAGETTIGALYNKYSKPKMIVEENYEAPSENGHAETEEEPAPRELTDEEWLATLPLSSKLEGSILDRFKIDALDYRHFAELRKKLADVAKHRFSRIVKMDGVPFARRPVTGKRGPWGYVLMRFLKCQAPRDWILCTTPEHGGCSGTGVTPLGECPKCHGAGYWIK